MFSLTDLIVMGSGLFLLLLWLLFFVKGKKHAGFFASLDENEYPLKEIYFVGYAILKTIRYRFKSDRDRKARKELSVLYGEKFAEYYLRVIYSQKITLAFTLLVLGPILYGLSQELVIVLVMVMFAGTAYYYYDTLAAEKIKKRSEEMLSDFSNVVSKLALLTNAGMILHEAWEEVAFTGDTHIYKEMQITVNEMNNGVSEMDALYRFGNRCIVPEIKKFTSTIVQGISKGNSELVPMLQTQSKEVWNMKKQHVRRQGEKASSKLLIPMMIMFVGILIMVIVPIFANIGA